jgi:hypothetical protein
MEFGLHGDAAVDGDAAEERERLAAATHLVRKERPVLAGLAGVRLRSALGAAKG